MTPRQYLEAVGSYNGETFEQEERLMFDTVIYPVLTPLTDTKLFQSDNKDRMYKNGSFPLSSSSFLVTKMRIFSDCEFGVVGTVLESPARRAHFLESSFLRITIENKIIGEYVFSELFDYNYMPSNFNTAATQFFAVRPKLNNYFVPDIPIKIGLGKQVDVDLLLAKNLTCSDVVANATPWHPNAGLVNDVGFVIKVFLKGYLYREAKAAA